MRKQPAAPARHRARRRADGGSSSDEESGSEGEERQAAQQQAEAMEVDGEGGEAGPAGGGDGATLDFGRLPRHALATDATARVRTEREYR